MNETGSLQPNSMPTVFHAHSVPYRQESYRAELFESCDTNLCRDKVLPGERIGIAGLKR